MLRFVLTLICLPFASLAQDGPNGVAFVTEPEVAPFVAFGSDPMATIAHATGQCLSEGTGNAPEGLSPECFLIAWCYPAGHSMDIFVQTDEGFHSHQVHCGLQSPEEARRIAEVICDPADKPWISV
jgi:hypothetical protein